VFVLTAWGAPTSATSTTTTLVLGASANQNNPLGGAGAGVLMSARPTGYCTTGAAGTISWTFALNVVAAGNTIIKAGSYVRYTRVA
jgi:hypothetical protein